MSIQQNIMERQDDTFELHVEEEMEINKRVLFVDDEEYILDTFRRKFRKKFKVYTVSNAFEAIELIKNSESFSVIVSDFNMPKMNGITFLEKAKNLSPDTVRILLTGYAELDMAINAVNEGNIFRFLTKPCPDNILTQAIESGIEQYRLIESESFLNRKLNNAYKELKNDLILASKVQMNFLPDKTKTIEGFKCQWLFKPSVFLSGDTFNFFKTSDHEVIFYIIDVAGHGVPAAILSISLSRALSPEERENNIILKYDQKQDKYITRSPSDVLYRLNEDYQSHEDSIEYFTMIYGIIDTAKETLTFCQAGHPMPIYIASENNIQFIGENNIPIGILPDQYYSEIKLPFFKNESIILYSDGITECKKSNSNQLFSEDRLLNLIKNNKIDSLENILINWTGSQKFEDDVTFLSITRI